jgi:hypothetical protein
MIEAVGAEINAKIRETENAQNWRRVLDRAPEFDRLFTSERMCEKDAEVLGVFDLSDPRRTPLSKKKPEIILYEGNFFYSNSDLMICYLLRLILVRKLISTNVVPLQRLCGCGTLLLIRSVRVFQVLP